MNHKLFLLFVLSLVVFVGCSRNELRKVIVSGTVTFEGLEQPPYGTLYFTPVEGTTIRNIPTAAEFNANGNYKVVTIGKSKNSGLLPGQYKVTVEAFKEPVTMQKPFPKSYAPDQYRDAKTTPLEVTIPQNVRKFTMDFTVKK